MVKILFHFQVAANKESSSSEEEDEEKPPKKVAKVAKQQEQEQEEEIELQIKKPKYDNFVKAGQNNSFNGNNTVSVEFCFGLFENVANGNFSLIFCFSQTQM